jgi:hypothetical protein
MTELQKIIMQAKRLEAGGDKQQAIRHWAAEPFRRVALVYFSCEFPYKVYEATPDGGATARGHRRWTSTRGRSRHTRPAGSFRPTSAVFYAGDRYEC